MSIDFRENIDPVFAKNFEFRDFRWKPYRALKEMLDFTEGINYQTYVRAVRERLL